jgi:predicted Zn-dependent protease
VDQSSLPPDLDLARLSRWITPVGRNGFSDLLLEWRDEIAVTISDGDIVSVRPSAESGVAARARVAGRTVLAAGSHAGEGGAREAIRRLAGLLPSTHFPKAADASAQEIVPKPPDHRRWLRRISGLVARAFPEHSHRIEIRRRRITRAVVPAGRGAVQSRRVLLSIQGEVRTDTRGGPRWRRFHIHLPEDDQGAFEEVRRLLRPLASSGPGRVAPPAGVSDVLFDEGSAAVLFHEILSHPLEADAPASRLAGLQRARVAPREVDVADEPARLDLFGGYPVDDEGTPGRRTPLLSAGHVAGPLRDRIRSDSLHPSTGNGRRAGVFEQVFPRGSNVVVGAGGASEEEMLHRLGSGLVVSEFEGGSVDPASGAFRLRFPSAQLVQRGRLAQALGPGYIDGDILEALSGLDSLLGARPHPCRALGWCSRDGSVLPVGGEAPAVIVRRLQVRPQ